MSGDQKTRGALLIDEMMRIGAESFDERNPAAADNATQLRRHLLADPRFVEYSLEYVESAPIPEKQKLELRNQTRIAHVEAISHLPSEKQDPALQEQVNALYERFNGEGRPEAGYTTLTPLNAELAAAAQSRFTPQGNPVKPAAAILAANTSKEPPPHPRVARPVVAPEAANKREQGESAYTIKKGDNLSKIAREQYDLTDARQIHQKALEIARHNGLPNANRISVGQSLKMPGLSPVPDATPNASDIIVTTRALKSESTFAGSLSANGRPIDTTLGLDWGKAASPANAVFMGQKPVANDLLAGTTADPIVMNPSSTTSLLGDAWRLGGTHVPEYLRTPQIPPAVQIPSQTFAAQNPTAP